MIPELLLSPINGTVNSDGAARTLELSVKYNEGADYAMLRTYMAAHPTAWQWLKIVDFVNFKNGRILVNNHDTGLIAKPNEWYRIAVEEHYNAADSRVYINGQVFNPELNDYIFGNRWTQMCIGMDATGKEGTRDVGLCVDNIKIYDSAYEPTGEEAIDYSIGAELNYGENTRGLYVDNTFTVEDVLGGIETDCEKYILESISSNQIKVSGAVEEGNVVIIKSADGRSVEYLYIYTSDESKIIDKDSFNEFSSYTMFGDTKYANKGVAAGLYGKGSGDFSFDMYSRDLPGNIESANRYNFMANNNACTSESFTKEFSLAGEGDWDALKFIVRSSFADSMNNVEYGYQEPAVFKPDGNIEVNGDRILQSIKFKPRQWYRIAITIYPYDCKYDLYMNGEKLLSKAWLAMNDAFWDSDKYDISSLQWFQIQPIYSADTAAETPLRNGHAYVDDTITYYGEYTGKQDIGLKSSVYDIDESEGTITVPVETDISDFVDGIDYGAAAPALYTDNTYSADVEDWLADGNVLVLSSEDGIDFRYYTVVTEKEQPSEQPSEKPTEEVTEKPTEAVTENPGESPTPDVFSVDDSIKLELNEASGDKPAKIKASINMNVPEAEDAKAVRLLIAVYDGAVLKAIKLADSTVSGSKLLEAEAELDNPAQDKVKAMLWDSQLKPFVNTAYWNYE